MKILKHGLTYLTLTGFLVTGLLSAPIAQASEVRIHNGQDGSYQYVSSGNSSVYISNGNRSYTKRSYRKPMRKTYARRDRGNKNYTTRSRNRNSMTRRMSNRRNVQKQSQRRNNYSSRRQNYNSGYDSNQKWARVAPDNSY